MKKKTSGWWFQLNMHMDYNSLQNRYSWNTAKVGVKHQPAIKIQYLPKRYIIDELHKYNSFFLQAKEK
jgi:hypothetical protein